MIIMIEASPPEFITDGSAGRSQGLLGPGRAIPHDW
jgi:hypothetical protein